MHRHAVATTWGRVVDSTGVIEQPRALRNAVVTYRSLTSFKSLAGAGLRIGEVEPMRLHVDVLHQTSWIPVYLDLDLDRVSWANGSAGGNHADLRWAVNSGLRAQLVSLSLVSGQLSANLDFHPRTEALLASHADAAFTGLRTKATTRKGARPSDRWN
jgi:hypothetical protein